MENVVMTKKREFPAVNLRHPMIVFWMVLFFIVSLFMIFLTLVMSHILLKCLFALFSFFGPFLLYYSLTAKILIDKQCIVKKSVFGAKELNFNEVKSFGVYLQEGKSIGSIERSEYDNTFWFAIKFIFVANRNDYSPNSFRQKGSIRFHYTKELYEAIEHNMNSLEV